MAEVKTPGSLLLELKQQAEHKASIKMFYAAADLLRQYTGRFAAETADEREELAAEYERRGAAAEKEAHEHGASARSQPVTPRDDSFHRHKAGQPLGRAAGDEPRQPHTSDLSAPDSVVNQSPSHRCPSCGTDLPQGFVVCVGCGLNLKTGDFVTHAHRHPTPMPARPPRTPAILHRPPAAHPFRSRHVPAKSNLNAVVFAAAVIAIMVVFVSVMIKSGRDKSRLILNCRVSHNGGPSAPVQGFIQVFECSRSYEDILRSVNATKDLVAQRQSGDGNSGRFIAEFGKQLGKALSEQRLVATVRLQDGMAALKGLPSGKELVLYGAGRDGSYFVGYCDSVVLSAGQEASLQPKSMSHLCDDDSAMYRSLGGWSPVSKK